VTGDDTATATGASPEGAVEDDPASQETDPMA